MIDRQRVRDAAMQVMLRMVPFVPVNEFRELYKALTAQNDEIDKQVEEAIASMRRSSETVARLEADLKVRMTKLQELRDEHQKMSKLAEISQEQSAAVMAALTNAIGSSAAKERWIAFAINIIAGTIIFLVGILAGPTITKWTGLT